MTMKQIDQGSENPRMQCSVCGRWMRLHGKRLEAVNGVMTEVAVQRFYGSCHYASGGDHLAGDRTDVCAKCCNTECKRLAGCDCQAPEVKTGAAGVSESCPIHAPKFIVSETSGGHG